MGSDGNAALLRSTAEVTPKVAVKFIAFLLRNWEAHVQMATRTPTIMTDLS